LAFFIIIEGVKSFLGIVSQLIIFRFLSNLLGIIVINVSLRSINGIYFERGLISQFILDLSSNIKL